MLLPLPLTAAFGFGRCICQRPHSSAWPHCCRWLLMSSAVPTGSAPHAMISVGASSPLSDAFDNGKEKSHEPKFKRPSASILVVQPAWLGSFSSSLVVSRVVS